MGSGVPFGLALQGCYYTHGLPSYTYLLLGSGVPFGLALQEATTTHTFLGGLLVSSWEWGSKPD